MSLAPRIDSLELATLQTDVIATRMGQKIYLSGAGVTVTCSVGVTSNRIIFIPYQMQDGTWRMRFNGTAVLTTTQTGFTLTITGAVFSNLMLAAAAYQAISVANNGGGSMYGLVDNGGNTIRTFASTGAIQWAFSGDVELASKPTWAS